VLDRDALPDPELGVSDPAFAAILKPSPNFLLLASIRV
jgi:hypothetical protein